MTITSVNEIQDGRDGLVDAVGGEISYTRIYRVITDDNYDEAATILADPRLPAVGTQYPYDPQCWLQRVMPRQEGKSKRIWIVTCEYATSKEGDGSNIDRDNPLLEVAKISFASEAYEFSIFKDRTGKAIKNSADEPFLPPPHIDKYRQVWTIKKNIINPTYAGWAALGTLNTSAVVFERNQGTIAAQMGLCRAITVSDWQVRNRIYYYTATITIVGPTRHSDGSVTHELETLDQGMHAYKSLPTPTGGQTANMYLVDCTDGTGAPTKGPALLDGYGKQFDPKEGVILLYWPVYPLASWSGLVPGIA